MTQIHRFSLLYDMAEDRMALDAEDVQGATTRLWLTQRLCRGLVKALIPMLRQTPHRPVAAENEAAVQSWEQAAAMASFGKVPNVKPRPEAQTGVVRAAHITPSSEGVGLSFDFGPDHTRTLALGHAEVRQMLAVLYRLSAAADWPLDLWPAWIGEPAPGAGADPVH